MRLPLIHRDAELAVMATYQDGVGEEPYEVNLGSPLDLGFGEYNHNLGYPALNPDTPVYTSWPPVTGGGGFVFPGAFYIDADGPNFEETEETGVVSWFVRNRGHVAGKLQLAFWFTDQDPSTDSPNSTSEVTFGGSTWDSTALRVHTFAYDPEAEGPPILLRAVGMRWFPGELRALA